MVPKLLANMFKRFLDKSISEEQSTFMEGRSITYNAFVAIQMIHAFKEELEVLNGKLGLKLT
jgi:hypothetical protein